MAKSATARLFFALWPDLATRCRLERAVQAAMQRYGGRPMRPETLHLTLLFLGAVARDRIDSVRLAGRVGGVAFSVRLDGLECWRHNHIAHLHAGVTPEPMRALVESLRQAMRGIGLDVKVQPFAAHVTLTRKAHCHGLKAPGGVLALGELPDAAIDWPVSEYVLAESRLSAAGPRYTVLERYPLTGIRMTPDGRRAL